MDISTVKCKRIIEEVNSAIKHWPEFAEKAKVPERIMEMVSNICCYFSERGVL